jgi:hypothetical protein
MIIDAIWYVLNVKAKLIFVLDDYENQERITKSVGNYYHP